MGVAEVAGGDDNLRRMVGVNETGDGGRDDSGDERGERENRPELS